MPERGGGYLRGLVEPPAPERRARPPYRPAWGAADTPVRTGYSPPRPPAGAGRAAAVPAPAGPVQGDKRRAEAPPALPAESGRTASQPVVPAAGPPAWQVRTADRTAQPAPARAPEAAAAGPDGPRSPRPVALPLPAPAAPTPASGPAALPVQERPRPAHVPPPAPGPAGPPAPRPAGARSVPAAVAPTPARPAGTERAGGGPTAAGRIRPLLPRLPEARPARQKQARTPAPAVHIGSVEVRVAAPAPPAAPEPPGPPPPAPRASVPRLSRPATAFGLGQG
jgi:hypothetical protein